MLRSLADGTDCDAEVFCAKCEGLRLVEQREAEDAHRLEALRAAVELGAADIAAGRFKSFDSKALLRDHLRSVANKAAAAA